MKPDWEKLAEEWNGHEVGLVAEVDCTAEGKPLCDANGIRGFPTLKYGNPQALDDYQGGRSYDDLSKFAKENLKPTCSPSNLDLCDAKKKKEIEGFLKLSSDDIDKKIKKFEGDLEKAEADFKSEVEKLQKKYQELTEAKEKKVEDVKNSGLGLLKAVKAFKAKDEKKDEL